ncbi:MAG TPA: MFS transporter [Dongiaceae bacterium]|nr:MFS transporter [Dongiaceae bacterium]
MIKFHQQHRTVLILAVAQSLANSCMSILGTVAALTGKMLAADPRLATVPLGLQFILTMSATIPASHLMHKLGRRNAFYLGAMIGLLGGGLSMAAAYLGSFILFCFGNAIMGASNAFFLHFRFAAAEAADDAFRPKAVSLVLAGGVVAAVVGPTLASVGTNLFAPYTFLGSYLFVALACLAMFPVLWSVHAPPPAASEVAGPQRPLSEIARQPVFLAALLAATFGYGTMVFVMTATPLAMVACGFPVGDVAYVISWHILGMFAPSFVTGHLIRRFGDRNVLLAGAFCYLGTVGFGLAGIEIQHFWLSLVLLGTGWNFLFIGGTALLTKCYRPAERAKVQGFNDFLIFSGVALCSLIAGVIEQSWGWTFVVWGALVPTLLIIAAVAWGAPGRQAAKAAV